MFMMALGSGRQKTAFARVGRFRERTNKDSLGTRAPVFERETTFSLVIISVDSYANLGLGRGKSNNV